MVEEEQLTQWRTGGLRRPFSGRGVPQVPGRTLVLGQNRWPKAANSGLYPYQGQCRVWAGTDVPGGTEGIGTLERLWKVILRSPEVCD